MRLIDADALKKELVFDYAYAAATMVDKAPTVDAVPVVHGRWVVTHCGWRYSYSCSECGAKALSKEETMYDQVCTAFCPYCGAKMDGDKRDNCPENMKVYTIQVEHTRDGHPRINGRWSK